MTDDDEAHTLFDRAVASLEDEAGGRFKKVNTTHVTGRDEAPTDAVAWSRDLALLKPEPPLGFRVDETADLGFPSPSSSAPVLSPTAVASRLGKPPFVKRRI